MILLRGRARIMRAIESDIGDERLVRPLFGFFFQQAEALANNSHECLPLLRFSERLCFGVMSAMGSANGSPMPPKKIALPVSEVTVTEGRKRRAIFR